MEILLLTGVLHIKLIYNITTEKKKQEFFSEIMWRRKGFLKQGGEMIRIIGTGQSHRFLVWLPGWLSIGTM
jgi:hypothetical protein